MKRLNDFMEFRLADFIRDKTLRVTGIKPWYEDKERTKQVGDSLEVACARDNTLHTNAKTGEQLRGINLYEKFTVKVPPEHSSVKIGDYIEIIDGKGTIYGDYRNNLSVRAKVIRVINPQSQGAQGGK